MQQSALVIGAVKSIPKTEPMTEPFWLKLAAALRTLWAKLALIWFPTKCFFADAHSAWLLPLDLAVVGSRFGDESNVGPDDQDPAVLL